MVCDVKCNCVMSRQLASCMWCTAVMVKSSHNTTQSGWKYKDYSHSRAWSAVSLFIYIRLREELDVGRVPRFNIAFPTSEPILSLHKKKIFGTPMPGIDTHMTETCKTELLKKKGKNFWLIARMQTVRWVCENTIICGITVLVMIDHWPSN